MHILAQIDHTLNGMNLREVHNRWRALWHPERFHGWGRKKRYFEGWYYKIVSADQSHALAIIPGISLDEHGAGHAFIQVMDGTRGTAHYHRFELSEFQPTADRFALRLGENFFAADHLQVQVPGLSADLRIAQITSWPKSFGAPGVMGWYSFVPFMECYHGIISMDHVLNGQANLQGQDIPMTGARGYLEKDWGTSFPACWVWLQTNHFQDADHPVSLFVSVARIPWLGQFFVGYLAGFLWNGHLHRFTSYLPGQMRAVRKGDRVILGFRNRHHVLEVEAKQAPGVSLQAPIQGNMVGKVSESLTAETKVRFSRRGGPVYFEGTGRHAGLEVAGETEVLWTEDWRS